MRWFFGTLLALLAGVGIYVGSALVSLGGLVETVLEFSRERTWPACVILWWTRLWPVT